MFAGAGILLGSVIANAASSFQIDEKSVKFEETPKENGKIKKVRSKINLAEMASENPNSSLGKKIRSKANLLDGNIESIGLKMDKKRSSNYKRLTKR